MLRRATIGVLFTAFIAGQAGAAEPSAPEANKPKFGDVTRDALSTTAPAFSMLGVQGETITAPEGLKKLGVALINGVDQNGSDQAGLAVQFAFGQLLAPASFSYWAYYTDASVRALARLQGTLALAQAKDSDHPKALRGAAGLIWVPFDTTDPFKNKALHDCLENLARPTAALSLPDSNGPLGFGEAVVDKTYQAAAAGCRNKYSLTPSDGFSSQIGFAKTFLSENGNTSDFKGKGFAANGVISIGLNDFIKGYSKIGGSKVHKSGLDSRLLLGALYRKAERVPDPKDSKSFLSRDRTAIGARALLGDDEKCVVGLEILHQNSKYKAGDKDKFTTYSATIDFRIASNLWITASYADTSRANSDFTDGSARFNGGLKFSIGPSSSLAD